MFSVPGLRLCEMRNTLYRTVLWGFRLLVYLFWFVFDSMHFTLDFFLYYPHASSVSHMDSAPLPLYVRLLDESAKWMVEIFLNVSPVSRWLAIMQL